MHRAAIVTLLVSGLAVLAAQPQQPIRVGTNFVRVDAYPTKDGRIVEGLQAADFEVLEDGVLQKIDTFEHVVATIGPYTARTEPNSQRGMVQALANPRNRVFLLFLDGPFVDDTSAREINEPLIKFLRTHLADDDLVGVMTPSMSASQVAFGKKTEVFADGVRSVWWSWGRQNRELDPELDRKQIQYGLCYPNTDVAGKMVARSRERATLESLQDAVNYLATIREERKAIIAVSEGWLLYREDPDLMRQRGDKEAPLGVDKMRVGPTGKLTLLDTKTSVNALSPNECDGDRSYLANIDNDKFLREIIDDANRGNSTFYMIDPGGLKVRGADRSGALRTLAENTDGLAVLNTNDLYKGLNKIAEDMASYYLLGYYASNTKPDGRFREITVRVKQPGVAVRARKGYRAPTAEEVTQAKRPVGSPGAPTAATPVTAAIDRLSSIRAEVRFRVNAIVGSGPQPALWVAGEVLRQSGRPDDFAQGGTADIDASAGSASTSARVTLKPGERTFVARMPLPAGAAGEVSVRARLTPAEGASGAMSDTARIERGAPGAQALLFRRGATTGNRHVPAADLRFSRTERVRVEAPVEADAKPGAGRLLDRTGQPLQVPVIVGERVDEATGQRWITADLALAALSGGDYAIEVEVVTAGQTQRVLSAIRVVR